MSTKVVIKTRNVPGPAPHNNHAIVSPGPFIFVSGQQGLDVKTGKFVEGPIRDRVSLALRNMEAIVKEAGSDLGKIIKVNVYLTDTTTYAEVNEAYKAILPDPKPARSCVFVQALPGGTDVEIECVAQL